MTRKSKDTTSWNPFVGCKFDCNYCKPSFQNNHYFVMQHKNCGLYTPHEHPERLARLYSDRSIFVCENSDIAYARPEFMREILQVLTLDKKPNRIFFLQSKAPRCFQQYLPLLPNNAYIVTTLETNRDEGYAEISSAPTPTQRYNDFLSLEYPRKIVTVEPIMDFDLDILEQWILNINPRAVFIGYNSKPNKVHLPEPDKKKTWQLIHNLEARGLRVFKKDMRDKRVWHQAYRDFTP